MRAFVPEDARPMFCNWANDPEVTRFLTWPTHTSEEVTSKVVASWVEKNSDPASYQWAIVWKETMEPIGSISVVTWRTNARIISLSVSSLLLPKCSISSPFCPLWREAIQIFDVC